MTLHFVFWLFLGNIITLKSVFIFHRLYLRIELIIKVLSDIPKLILV